MSFNYDKNKVIHFGKNNNENVDTLEKGKRQQHLIEKILVERDLRLIVSSDI